MKDFPRSYRVADQIQQELSGLIRHSLKDPRLSPMLTITSVDVTRDLSFARVYYSVMNSEERDDTQRALERSVGYLRRQLGSALSLRVVPQLQFHYDSSIEDGARMSALIDQAVSSNTTDADTDAGQSMSEQPGTDDDNPANKH